MDRLEESHDDIDFAWPSERDEMLCEIVEILIERGIESKMNLNALPWGEFGRES